MHIDLIYSFIHQEHGIEVAGEFYQSFNEDEFESSRLSALKKIDEALTKITKSKVFYPTRISDISDYLVNLKYYLNQN